MQGKTLSQRRVYPVLMIPHPDQEKAIFINADISIDAAIGEAMAAQDRIFSRSRSSSLSSLSSTTSSNGDDPCYDPVDGLLENAAPPIGTILTGDADPSTDAVPSATPVAKTRQASKKRRRRIPKEGKPSHQSKRLKRNPPVRTMNRKGSLEEKRRKKAAANAVHTASDWTTLRTSRKVDLTERVYTLEEVKSLGLTVVSWDGM